MDFGAARDAALAPDGELGATGAAAIADIAAEDGCGWEAAIGAPGLVASARVLSLAAGSTAGATTLESGAAGPKAWELGAEDGASVAGGC